MPNRLMHETSPYLLQHADNPVDWYPWGDEALDRARREDKPILLSIGYSACHWCHVMEHESFENPDIARLMNEHFVNIKVDREERPDLDAVYMDAVQAMTGHGGWPMTVFLTPEGKPFYGGTYFPPSDRGGMPGLPRVLDAVAEAYRNRRDAVNESADRLVDALQQSVNLRPSPAVLTVELLDQAVQALAASYDARYGGFGTAPKFPSPMALEFLLRTFIRTGDPQARAMIVQTLDAMAHGGIYDQIGGGFHRYSVDAYWLVPHFEKMLYDNAQLSRVYLLAYQVLREPFYCQIAEETLDYVLREMTDPTGGFYSTQDADSEGEEGKYYLWTPAEVEAVVGPEAARLVERYFDITPGGNFEGKSIAHVTRAVAEVAAELGLAPRQAQTLLEGARRKLLGARAFRVHPGRDEKVLTSWNGLMLRSFAEAARVLRRADYREAAVRNAEFVLAHLCRGDRLLHTWKSGEAKLMGFLEDYAYYADGLVALYEATFDLRWLEAARQFADAMCGHFWDQQRGGFFDVADDAEQLVVRPKGHIDNATPSGNAVAADLLLHLAAYFDVDDYRQRARQILELLSQPMTRYPSAFGRTLLALDFHLAPRREVAIVGEPGASDREALLRVVDESYLPYVVVAARAPDDQRAEQVVPLLAHRPALDGKATAYVCEHFVCKAPTISPEEFARQLGVAQQ